MSRRIKHAIDLGYLIDQQEKQGQPALLQPGDPLPADVDVLPGPELFAQECCSVAVFSEGEVVTSEVQFAENTVMMVAQ